MAQRLDTDVLVVGSGLAGGACANVLLRSGIECTILEQKRLPREKPCSGIISPRGHSWIKDNLGPIPQHCLNAPNWVRGVNFLFRDGTQLPIDFTAGPTPQVWRCPTDHWVAQRSGAPILQQHTFHGYTEERDHVRVLVRNPAGRDVTMTARYLVAADGPHSAVVEAMFPGYRSSIQWFYVGQNFYRARIDLDEEYFHFLIHPSLGYYTWTHKKDDDWIIGNTIRRGLKYGPPHRRVIDYLSDHHGLKIERETKREGCLENFGVSIKNEFVFGKGRGIVVGQAAGFLNMMAEGMSAALYSGDAGARSIARALSSGREVLPIYLEEVSEERRRTVDQWNIVKMVLGNPHEADLKTSMSRFPLRRRLAMLSEMRLYAAQFVGLGWGWPIARTLGRWALTGRY